MKIKFAVRLAPGSGQPGRLRAEPLDLDGAARLRWERPVRRRAFLVEMTTDPSAVGGWKQCETTGRQSCVVKGLMPGVQYWFRVAATNTQGQGRGAIRSACG